MVGPWPVSTIGQTVSRWETGGKQEEKHAGLLETNTLVRTLRQKLENDVGFTRLNIESLKLHAEENKHVDVEENKQVDEFNRVLLEIGDFQHKKLSGLGLHQRYDEDIIRREEIRIDLEQSKIG
jgi:CPA1 family monovalent cation:H+ antiporter